MHLSSISGVRRPHAAWTGLIQVWSMLSGAIEAQLQSRWGLSHAEFEVLLRLGRSSAPLRVQDLASRSLISRSGTSRAVGRLEKARLVMASRAPEDGRGTVVSLTNKGRAVFADAAPARLDLVAERYLSRFTVAELDRLADFWARILDEPSSLPENTRKVQSDPSREP